MRLWDMVYHWFSPDKDELNRTIDKRNQLLEETRVVAREAWRAALDGVEQSQKLNSISRREMSAINELLAQMDKRRAA